MAELVLENVSKKFGDFTAVEDFNMRVKDGEFVVLVGPSGCGKTTVLRMIAGLEDVSSGSITIDGELVNDIPPKDRDVAMVFQSYALYPHMNVFDNMSFGLKARRTSRAEVIARVEEAANILKIADQLEKKPGQLSGGQRQRVAVGRAIVRKPKVFLFDEPLSNLDAKLRVTMRAELARLHQNIKTTMIYVTHDQAEAMTLGDRVAVLKDGRIQQVAEPQVLYDSPSNLFVASFIGSPSMNFLDIKVAERDGGLQLQARDLVIPLPAELKRNLRGFRGRHATLGIRPEDIHDVEAGPVPERVGVISARVEVMENMGSDIFLHLAAGGESLLARVAGGSRAQVGDSMELALDMEKAHLFDPSTGETVV